MGVRVRLRVKYGSSSLDLVALVNTGYETDVPELLVPVSVAERLGLWPKLPESTIVETYKTASGLMTVYRVRGARASSSGSTTARSTSWRSRWGSRTRRP